MGTARRQYTDEFKWEVVGLLASSAGPLRQIAEELGSAASRLRAWRNRGAGADVAAENARPRRANERPRMEREIVKKTPRIFAEAPR